MHAPATAVVRLCLWRGVGPAASPSAEKAPPLVAEGGAGGHAPSFGGKGTAGGNGGREDRFTGQPPAEKARLVAVEGEAASRPACLEQ